MKKRSMIIERPPGWERVGVRKYLYKFRSESGVTTEICITRLKDSKSHINLWVSVSSYRKRKDKKLMSSFSEGLSRLIKIRNRIDEFAEFQECDVKIIIAGADSQRKRVYRWLERYGYRQDRHRGRLVLSKLYIYEKDSHKERVYRILSNYLSELYGCEIFFTDEETE